MSTAILHDYTDSKRSWGWDYAIVPVSEDDTIASVTGWGKGISKGDRLMFTHPEDMNHVIYEVLDIRYYRDPSDQFVATARFMPLLECRICGLKISPDVEQKECPRCR